MYFERAVTIDDLKNKNNNNCQYIRKYNNFPGVLSRTGNWCELLRKYFVSQRGFLLCQGQRPETLRCEFFLQDSRESSANFSGENNFGFLRFFFSEVKFDRRSSLCLTHVFLDAVINGMWFRLDFPMYKKNERKDDGDSYFYLSIFFILRARTLT